MLETQRLLAVKGFHIAYGCKQVIKGVDLTLNRGQFTALLGLNGSGKTTLLKAICGMVRAVQGKSLVYDEQQQVFTDTLRLDEYRRARLISYVPQRHSTIYNTPVLEVVLMGFNPHLHLLEQPSAAQRSQARQALGRLPLPENVGDEDFLHLSEGQKQLVILARSLVQNAPVMLMDEPDSALDFVNRHLVMDNIREIIHTEHKAGLITLHDPNFAMSYCDRLLLLSDGVIAADLDMLSCSKDELKENLSLVYGEIEILEHSRGYVMVKKDK